MITPEQKQALEAKIREAVPESMEMKFGCLCQNNWAASHEPYIYMRKSGTSKVFWSEQFKKEIYLGKRRKLQDRDPYTILGRPLQFADVCLALPDNLVEIRLSNPLVLIVKHDGGDVYYDLTKDYHWNIENNPKFGILLHSLLC